MKRKMVLIGTIVLALVFGLVFTTCDDPPAKDETTYTVSFNSNGGSGTVPPQEALDGTSITLPPGSGLSRSGYTFGGWNTNAAGTGTNYNVGASYTVTGNVTLYAKWNSGSSGGNTVIALEYNEYGEASSYWQTTVGIDSFLNGSKITAGNVYILNYSFRSNVAIDGLQVVLVDTTPAANYWNALSSYLPVKSNISANTVVSGTISFTATATATNTTGIANCIAIQAGRGTASAPTLTFTTFELKREADITYTVTFNTNGGTGTPPASQTVSSGATITLPGGSELSKSGYTFGGWNTNAAGTGTNYNAGASYTVNGDVTLYALWQLLVTYTVTFNANGGTGTPPASQTVSSGTAIALPSGSGLSKSGYSFGGWNTNSSGTGTNYNAGASYTVNSTTTLYAVWRVSAPEGIYVEILSFGRSTSNLTANTPVLLDNTGKTTLTNMINQNYVISSIDGTSLFYAVHKAMANLTSNEGRYPANLASVSMITFTDGLDVNSEDESYNYPIEGISVDDDDYPGFISSQLENRLIAGKPIAAYSIGVQGRDVTNTARFENNLASIASQGNSYKLDNFDEVREIFDGIARNLYFKETTFVLDTPPLTNGMKFRITFDVSDEDPLNAAASTNYIEGIWSRTGTAGNFTYAIENLVYGGTITSSIAEGSTLIGTRKENNNVDFNFYSFEGYEFNINPVNREDANVKEWRWIDSEWQVNSEYKARDPSRSEKLSAVIYLVLDNSTSLKPRPTDNLPDEYYIDIIRTEVTRFITSVYDRYFAED